MTALKSPLVWVTAAGLLLGALVGVGSALLAPGLETADVVVRQEDRRPPTAPIPVSETDKPSAQKVTLSDQPWWHALSVALNRHEFDEALTLVGQIDDHKQRALALRETAGYWPYWSGLLEKKTGYLKMRAGALTGSAYYGGKAAAPETLQRDKAEYDEENRRFEEEKKQFQTDGGILMERGTSLAEELADSKEKVAALASLAEVHYLLNGDKSKSRELLARARDAFEEYQAGEKKSHAWNRIRSGWAEILRWAGTLGIGGLTIAVFGNVFSFYLVRHVATRIGDEDLARHLGATIKFVKKASLILPDDR